MNVIDRCSGWYGICSYRIGYDELIGPEIMELDKCDGSVDG